MDVRESVLPSGKLTASCRCSTRAPGSGLKVVLHLLAPISLDALGGGGDRHPVSDLIMTWMILRTVGPIAPRAVGV
jgi:hypothetical protein